ncbi:hypothetical protein [endosymbiont GvMRE of Glomus versiforme]|uniref:hypothetical protein n=1 Tax=endosymbiont GvMRE of Glomus versiforme TaxID=2039283 RepID=UPI0011C41432|nr:hypothetical protein [endosymbiont GvMRE of Glomus versiforme]
MFSFKEEGSGYLMIAMAFLTYALFKSQAVQSLLASKKKWLQKKRFTMVVIITIAASFLSAIIDWESELIHFYPTLLPLFLDLGFDAFSPFLCLYGGYVAGSLVFLSPENRTMLLNRYVNKYVGSTKFTMVDALPFSILCWIIFTTIVVLFNVWYCNKISHNSSRNLQEFSKKKSEKVPLFNWKRKLTLFLTFFFVLIGILGSISYFASKNKNKKEWTAEEKENYKIITNEDLNTEPKYTELGKIKIGEGEESEMKIAKVEEEKKSYWGKFGEWGARQLTYWYTIGAMVICLLNSLEIIETLTKSVIKTVPLIINWTLIATTFGILDIMRININFGFLKVDSSYARFYILPALFVIFSISTVILGFVGYLVGPLTKILASVSRRTALYGFYSILMSRYIATNVGHSNVNLDVSLQAVKVSKKEYYKKTWLLWLILFITGLIIVITTPWFIERTK